MDVPEKDLVEGKPFRYPGPRAFGDTAEERQLFFGRQEETDALLFQVLADYFVVVFGRSGHGKSSLVRAGLLQALRENGHFPFIVRLNQTGKPADTIRKGALTWADSRGVTCRSSPGSDLSLWHFFKLTEWSVDDQVLQPVLILDQFEELFTLMDPAGRSAFVREFADLVRGTRPRDVDESGVEVTGDPPRIKVVIVMRGDYLWELESLPRNVPQVFRSRFRVEPLRPQKARLAIKKPARDTEGDWRSPPFKWSNEAADQLLEFLIEGNRGGTERRAYVEPFFLQLLCQEAEQGIIDGTRESPIEPRASSGNFDKILEEYYQEGLRSCGDTRWKTIRRLCEHGLISRSGERLSVRLEQIEKEYGVTPDEVAVLVNRRLLTSYLRRAGRYYELSHDALVEPIQAVRQRHERQQRRRGMGAIVTVLSVLGLWYFTGVDDRRDRRLVEAASQVLDDYPYPQNVEVARSLLNDVFHYPTMDQWTHRVDDALAPFFSEGARVERVAPSGYVVTALRGPEVVSAAGSGFATWDVSDPQAVPIEVSLDDLPSSLWPGTEVLRVASVGPDSSVGLGFEGGRALLLRHPQSPDSVVSITRHEEAVRAIAFNSDATRVATADESGTIRLIDIEADQPRLRSAVRAAEEGVYHLAFHPLLPDVLVSATRGGELRVWDVGEDMFARSSDSTIDALPANGEARIDGLRFGAEGRSLVVLRRGAPSWLVEFDVEGRVEGVDASTLDLIALAEVSPDGRRLLTIDDGGVVRYRNLEDGTEVGEVRHHVGTGEATWVALNDSASAPFFAATARRDGSVMLWAHNREQELFDGASASGVLTESADGQQLLITAAVGGYRMWNLADLGMTLPLREAQDAANDPDATPEERAALLADVRREQKRLLTALEAERARAGGGDDAIGCFDPDLLRALPSDSTDAGHEIDLGFRFGVADRLVDTFWRRDWSPSNFWSPADDLDRCHR